jgi:uncharacterized protein YjbI with pentapeptide repeats
LIQPQPANLRYVFLGGADLNAAHLFFADLRYANLDSANLGGADLSHANLSGANLHDANLEAADLSNADLSQAWGWTNEQLAKAHSLVGATLPDRPVMTEDAWEEFKRRYRK